MSDVIKFSPKYYSNYTKFVTSFNTKCVSHLLKSRQIQALPLDPTGAKPSDPQNWLALPRSPLTKGSKTPPFKNPRYVPGHGSVGYAAATAWTTESHAIGSCLHFRCRAILQSKVIQAKEQWIMQSYSVMVDINNKLKYSCSASDRR